MWTTAQHFIVSVFAATERPAVPQLRAWALLLGAGVKRKRILQGCMLVMLACSTLAAEDSVRRADAEGSRVPVSELEKLGLDPNATSELESDLAGRNYPKAESVLLAQIRLSEHPRLLLEALGGVLFLDREYLQAAITLKKAEGDGPLSENAHFTLAMSYVELKRNDWARDELARLARARPAEPLYPYWLGRLDYEDQRFTSALTEFKKAIEAEPHFVRPYDGLGLVYEAMGDVDAAERNYQTANRLNREQGSKLAWPALNYGRMLREAARYSEARALFQEALAIDPSVSKAHYQLGRLEESFGHSDAAIAHFQSASHLDPQDPSPVYALYRLYRKTSETDHAASMIARFRELTAKGDNQH